MKFKILQIVLIVITMMMFSEVVSAQGGALPLNNSVTGNITSTIPDVWDITTTADGLLRLTLHATAPADLYLTLYDNDGTTVLGNQIESFNNSFVTLSADGLAPGTYHVKIKPFSTAFGAYTLADSLFTTVLAIDAEPNGTRATAVTLAQNNSTTGHAGYYYNNKRDTADWYKVTTNSDGLLRVYLTTARGSIYSNNPLDVNVTLYDNDGTTPLGFMEVFNANGPASNIITTDGLAPGTYYLKVQPFSANEFANYTISDSLILTPVITDAEPNGNRSLALTIPLNGSASGHLGYYYNNDRDTADWYKVTTTADGLLRVYLASARGSIYSNNPLDVNVTLYDNDGTTPLGFMEVFNANGPASNIITTDGLAPGTYYLKVQPFSTSEFANYTISDSLIMPVFDTDAEPNGNRSLALTIPLNGSASGHLGYYYNNNRDTADWYKVTTTADGLLRVYLTSARGGVYSNNTLDVNVTLYDNDGTTQLGFMEVFNANGPASNIITTDGLAPGTYYLKVQPFSTSEFANYTISDSLLLPIITTDAEPNGTAATAVVIPPNVATSGHLGYYYNNRRDSTDWYKITIGSAGFLHLTLKSTRGSIYSNNTLDMMLYVYNSDASTLQGSVEIFNGAGPATGTLNLNTLPAGTYYIKVTNFSSSQFSNYTFSDSTVEAGPLPVRFIDFNGTVHAGQASLHWSTATELNNKGFEVEKSMDGSIFSSIGFVNGNTNSSVNNNYSYTDFKVLSGFNYYRLKQVDLDGNFRYSSTIRLDFKNFGWAIMGNPVTSNTWIQLQLAKTSVVDVQVMGADGRIVKSIHKGTMDIGTYSMPLNTGNLAPGTYIVRLIVDKISFIKRVIK
jgi:hypothetical protein